MERQSWEDYFFDVAKLAAKRTTCIRRAVGAVLVKDNRILASGYNGAPSKVAHCTKDTCLRKDVPSGQRHELCTGVHAEQNVLVQAARFGIPTEGTEIYCTHKPCSICVKLMINAGITRVYYLSDYPDPLTDSLLGNREEFWQPSEGVTLELVHHHQKISML